MSHVKRHLPLMPRATVTDPPVHWETGIPGSRGQTDNKRTLRLIDWMSLGANSVKIRNFFLCISYLSTLHIKLSCVKNHGFIDIVLNLPHILYTKDTKETIFVVKPSRPCWRIGRWTLLSEQLVRRRGGASNYWWPPPNPTSHDCHPVFTCKSLYTSIMKDPFRDTSCNVQLSSN